MNKAILRLCALWCAFLLPLSWGGSMLLNPYRFTSSTPPPTGIVATDDFAWAGGTVALNTDADWTLNTGTINALASGRIQPATAGDVSLAYFDSVAPSENQRIELTLTSLTPGVGTYLGPAGRIQAGAHSGYYVYVSGSGDISLERVIAGNPQGLQYDGAASITSGNRVALIITGSGSATRLSVEINTGGGWIHKWTNIDPIVYLGPGYGGVRGYDNGATHGDDFVWENL